VADYDDLQIRDHGDPLPPPPSTSSPWKILLILVLVVVVAGVAYWLSTRRASPPAETAVTEPPPPVEGPPPRSPLEAGPPADLPPLGASDDAVRDLVRDTTEDSFIGTWLTTAGLLRQVASGLQAIASGLSPARHLQKLAPSEPFRATSSGGRLVIDPGSYARYDRVANAVESISPEAAVRLYGAVKPRLDDAMRELGVTGVTTDEFVERAIRQLLATPILEQPPALERNEGLYRFADPKLENLPPAQKQLLRMGPENTRRIQAALRAIARALGIPDDRLPQAPTQ
jgi:DUF3014 family protein